MQDERSVRLPVPVPTPQTAQRMRRVGRRDTEPELTLRRALAAAGVTGYRVHWGKVPGSPDLAWVGRKLAVFVDGAFWHGHPSRYWPGRCSPYWDQKIARNQRRDAETTKALADAGWQVVRLWDFEVRKDVAGCVSRIRSILGK